MLYQLILQLPSCLESIYWPSMNTETDSSSDSLVFWKNNQSACGKLILAVLHSFDITASSAPVERVFSHGGLVGSSSRWARTIVRYASVRTNIFEVGLQHYLKLNTKQAAVPNSEIPGTETRQFLVMNAGAAEGSKN